MKYKSVPITEASSTDYADFTEARKYAPLSL
jgi:hypothetical protein